MDILYALRILALWKKLYNEAFITVLDLCLLHFISLPNFFVLVNILNFVSCPLALKIHKQEQSQRVALCAARCPVSCRSRACRYSPDLYDELLLNFFNLHSGRWSRNWVHSSGRPLTGLFTCPGWLWGWRIWWNEWQGKPKYSEKTCPGATLSTTNPTWPDPGLDPGRRGGKPATNRFSYGAAQLLLKVCRSLKTSTVSHTKSVNFSYMIIMGQTT
jgi:hypothetical protein